MRNFMILLKNEGKLSLRCPDGIIFGILMPMGIFCLIGILSKEDQGTYLQNAFASLLTVGICATAFMGLPLTFADYRDKKILKHFFVTPVHPFKMMLVQVCIAMLTAIVSSLAVTCIAVFGFQYHMEGNLWLFLCAYVLVMLSMYSIGMLISSVCKTIKIANIVTTAVYFPMVFLSGATIPFELFPNSLQNIANFLPLTHGIKLLKEVSLGIITQDAWISVCLMVVFTIVSTILSIVLFKWE